MGRYPMGKGGLRYLTGKDWVSFFIRDLNQRFDTPREVGYWNVADGGVLITDNYRNFSDRLAIL